MQSDAIVRLSTNPMRAPSPAIACSYSKGSQAFQAAESDTIWSAKKDKGVSYSHLPAFFNSAGLKEDVLKRNVWAPAEEE